MDFAKKTHLANLKSEVDKLDIDKLKPTGLNNLKTKVNKLDTCSCWFKETKWGSKKWCCQKRCI